MRHEQRKKRTGLFLVFLLVLIFMSTPFRQFMSFPSELRLFAGNLKELSMGMPAFATVTLSDPEVVEVNGSQGTPVHVNLKQPMTLLSKQIGHTQLTLRLFGKLPLKKLNVRVLPDVRVIPGGQSIGVKLKSQGVLVVGHHLIPGSKKSPGEKADIRVGDYIVKMDGKPIREVSQVTKAIEQAGEENRGIHVVLKRGGRNKKVILTPIQDQQDQSYRTGLYVRNAAAGVGTLTFYDPRRHVYGALGHVITDVDTGEPITAGGGKIVHSNVTSIQKGATGEPGEKRAIFFRENQVLGSIVNNTPFGVFGKMKKNPDEGLYKETVPVALAEEVKEGHAEILTVVEGQKVERYDIEIVHLIHQKYPATKGMIIKVTDPRLLKKTGGIVQGMSGSPIMQNGKMVGAVTHVFVNDPASGYGTYIEWMLRDAGVLQSAGLHRDPFFSVEKTGIYRKRCSCKEGLPWRMSNPFIRNKHCA